MPAVSISTTPKLQFFDANGAPLAGGLLYTYEAGTTTPLATYTDSTGVSANINPIVLDSRGEANVWLSSASYKLALYSATNVLIWTVDNLNGPDQATLAALAASGGSALIGYIAAGTGAVPTTVQAKLRESVSVLDFGASPSASALINNAAFAAAFAASSHVKVPAGNYSLSATLTLDGSNGFILEGDGAALANHGVRYAGNTIFNFDSTTAGSNGLVFTNFVGLTLKNFLVSLDHGGAGAGVGILLSGGHDYSIESVCVDSQTASTGNAIVLGEGTGATSTFQGNVKNCKVLVDGGYAIVSAATNTSITLESCYSIGGGYLFNGTTYSSAISCAVDNAGGQGNGFVLTECNALSFISCGCEFAQRSMFYMDTDTTNITIVSPRGANNNTSANVNIGDLVHMDSSVGAVRGITIINPGSTPSNAATTSNIAGTANTGIVDVYGIIPIYLPLGFGGDATWQLANLTRHGEGENISFAPTLNANWTNVGTPTIAGTYNKKGKQIYFSITITPATSIKANAGAQIILPWTAAYPSGALVYDGNSLSYSTGIVNGTIIYIPTTAVLTVELVISGTMLI
jgi:hypothetical protein